jgi:hypothetical protein
MSECLPCVAATDMAGAAESGSKGATWLGRGLVGGTGRSPHVIAA